MRFACLVYIDPSIAFNGSAESNAILNEAGPAARDLVAQGFISEALTLPSDAVTLRLRGGKLSATDGPFMETKEVLAGLIIIEAADMEAAKKIAATNPMIKFGAVEVRPLVDFSKPRPVL
jgi:hypothetical protein